jgi:hypothetical protein
MNSPALVRPPFSRPVCRRGLSLMELLIATTISIMVMGATVTLFGVVGERINGGRAMIEVADRLRSTQNLLHHDLRGVTVSFLPWEQPSAGSGYFEILKGPQTNNAATSNRDSQPNAQNVLLGYTRDVLMFTTRSPDQPFTGRFQSTTIESPVAEVVWYTQPTFNAQNQITTPLTYTLYRRQFLVVPSPTPLPISSGQAGMISYYDQYDVSARPDGKGNVIANSLADLTYRENRFAHNNIIFAANAPFFVNFFPLQSPPTSTDYNAYSMTPFQPPYLANGASNPVGSQRYGEDVVLTNVLSFDVKVWDPGAAVLPDTSQRPLVPSDPGYSAEFTKWKAASYPATWNAQPVQYGAYVDLNYANNAINYGGSVPPSYFAGPFYGNGKKSLLDAGAAGTNGFATFDTWSLGYEYYTPGAATSTYNYAGNGFDNDGANGVNDANERISSPPYPVPLRGVQIKIRVYEPSTRQVREITVAETFLPD